jgi:DNA polymerase III gamma/tau subunit
MLDQISGLSSDEELDETLVAQLLGVPNNELLEDLIKSLQESNTNLLFDTTMKLKIQGASATNTAKSLIELLRQKIAEDNTIDKNRAVGVMKALLPFTASQSSFEAIEVAFLDEFEFTKITSLETKNEQVKVEPELKTKPVTEEVIIQEDITESNVIINNSDTNDWNTVLNELKNTHNTLYGVLRMAKADINNDVITLTFAFEFHKKQLNQNKNLDVLNTIIENKLGKRHNLELIVAKKPKKQEKTTLNKSADNSDENLKSVSNIFGGAELLES